MHSSVAQYPSGHVFLREGTRGPVWYAKYRLPDGRQRKKKIGPAWRSRGRPPAGYFTKRLAQEWLRSLLDEARAGTLAGMCRTGATFADASAEYLRYIEFDRQRKPSTVAGYRALVRSQLDPAFGPRPIEEITTLEIEAWIGQLLLANSSRTKILILMHGIFKRARKRYGLPLNPVADVERPPTTRGVHIDVFSPEEILSLVRAAANEQDAAIFLTAAFTGLRRGELLALCWRDVDFSHHSVRVRASYAEGVVTSPKSGKVRSVPMAPDVATALARLGQREHLTGADDLVFIGDMATFLDGSALRRRYKKALVAAGLRQLRFHDLRHTFGTRMIGQADIRRVQEWMGHADVQTTMRYLHYVSRDDEAALVAAAFAVEAPPLLGAR